MIVIKTIKLRITNFIKVYHYMITSNVHKVFLKILKVIKVAGTVV